MIISLCTLAVVVYLTLNFFRLLYGPKINIEDEDIKKGSVREWKLQPKVSYDDDNDDDQANN